MRSCDDVQRALSAFIDGELPAKERAALREHLGSCDVCRGLHADLLRLRGAARTLGPVAPPDHVWLEVAGRIRLQEAPAAPPRAPAVTSRAAAATRAPSRTAAAAQWIGLAAALLVITFGLFWLQQTPADAPPDGTAAQATPVDSVNAQLNLALQHSLQAIGELEKMAASNGAAIDPEVAAMIQQNLALTDEAIAESRTALSTNPDSEAARASLFDALRRKISTLQTTVSLINEMRQGDQEGAARVAEGAGKKS